MLLATVAQFVVGMVWYMPLFGKLWGKMHGFDGLSKEKQKEKMRQMGPYYVVQLFVTILTAFVLAKLLALAPDYSPYKMAGLVWLGIAFPANVSAVIFGGTDGKWVLKKIAVMAGGSLVCLVAAVLVISNIQ